MTRTRLPIVLCYLPVALGLLGAGLRYALALAPMPYHLQLLAGPFEQLPVEQRALLMALIHGAGAAMSSGALALLVLMFWPLWRGQHWARHAVPALSMSGLAPLLWITLDLRQQGADTPWLGVTIAMIAVVLGWVWMSLRACQKGERASQ